MKAKKILKIVGLTLLAILAVVILVLAGIFIYSKTYSIPEQDAKIENTTGLVQAHNRALYDAEGNIIQLHGVNAGQILLQEGWMSPFALEPLKNADGSYVKDGGDNIQYPEFTEEVDNLTSSNRRDLQDFIIDCVTDGLYVLINYGRNWCEYITPESYANSEKRWGPRYALGYATHVYDGDTSMFK